MKIGQKVNLYFPDAAVRKDAEVVEIVGIGESRAKCLNLRFKDGDVYVTIKDVAHHRDAATGDVFWLLKGTESAPAGWADVTPEEPPPEHEVIEEPEDE